MEISMTNLEFTLTDFAQDPTKWWGQPTDGNGNPASIEDSRQAARTAEAGDLPVFWYWSKGLWEMQAFGTIGARGDDQLTFSWYSLTSGGNTRHQRLEARWQAHKHIAGMRFTTAAANAKRCYTIQFDCRTSVREFSVHNGVSVNLNKPRTRLDKLEDVVLDLIVAMIPAHMLHAHHPRDPVTGAFAL